MFRKDEKTGVIVNTDDASLAAIYAARAAIKRSQAETDKVDSLMQQIESLKKLVSSITGIQDV